MNRKLRIAMVAACPFPCPRGTPIRIFKMAQALVRRGHEVEVVTYHLGDETAELPFKIHRIRNVPTYHKISPGPTYQKVFVLDVLLAFKLRRVLLKGNFDVIHAHHIEGLLATLVAKGMRNIPVVFDAHTLLESELPYYDLGMGGVTKKWIGRRFDKRFPRFARYTIAVSEPIKTTLVNRGAVPEDRISVIPNGVDIAPFDIALRDHRDFQSTCPTVIFTGNLAPYQGVELLLQAFSKAKEQHRDARLKIVTEDDFGVYESLVQTLGIRQAIDWIKAGFEAVPALLVQADVAVNPRVDCDGLPQKLLNYMAAGIAIVSFEGAARYLHHEENALVVANNDTDAFAHAIGRLFDDAGLRERLGRSARDEIDRELSWSKTAASCEQVYEQLLGAPQWQPIEPPVSGRVCK